MLRMCILAIAFIPWTQSARTLSPGQIQAFIDRLIDPTRVADEQHQLTIGERGQLLTAIVEAIRHRPDFRKQPIRMRLMPGWPICERPIAMMDFNNSSPA